MNGWIWNRMTILGLSVKNNNGISWRDWIQFLATFYRSRQLQLCGIQCWLQPWNQVWWSQCLAWHRHCRVSSMRPIWNRFQTGELVASRKCESHRWESKQELLTCRKTDGICTLFCLIPQHLKRKHQAMGYSHAVNVVLGLLMSLIGTRRGIAWAGEFRWLWELDSSFKLPQHRDSIHSMTGVSRRCGCLQLRLKIQRMRTLLILNGLM